MPHDYDHGSQAARQRAPRSMAPQARTASAGAASLGLPVFLVVCLVAAALGGWLTNLSVGTWYVQLRKPPGTPPDWVFAPVWTSLYVMMAVAGWMIWERRRESRWAKIALRLFALQLALNVAWSAFFFAMRSPGVALVDIVVLWIAILATLVAAWRAFRPAGLLLGPYLAWVSYAAYLNAGLYYLNA